MLFYSILFYSILCFATVIVIIVIQKSSYIEFVISNLSADMLDSSCGHQQKMLVIIEATLLCIMQFNMVLLNRTVLSHMFKKEITMLTQVQIHILLTANKFSLQ